MTTEKTIKKMRHCWNCGDEMGVIENKFWDRNDVCGKSACFRAQADQERAERDAAHEKLDRDMGW